MCRGDGSPLQPPHLKEQVRSRNFLLGARASARKRAAGAKILGSILFAENTFRAFVLICGR